MPTLKLFEILFDNTFKQYDDTGMFVCLAAFIYYTIRHVLLTLLLHNLQVIYNKIPRPSAF